ncbi:MULTISPECIES: 5'/3'-nucleotidase SurE [Clostridia]|uniref:5'/3'-nucleotidase SurE n=1 Tax=Clostridia TaxID=186801 RepID=UPI0032174E3E
MNILITNDDGITAKGIQIIAQRLQSSHNILVVAPDSQKSASSHSITLTNPLMVKKEKIEGVEAPCFSVSGTPVDCTKIAITTIASEKIDIVVSGINDGFNLGTDVIYSGTVSAAVEGALNNTPAIALSCDGNEESFEIAADYAEKILNKIRNEEIGNTVLNVNIPSISKDKLKGLKVCKIGERNYNNVYVEVEKSDENVVYKITGAPDDAVQDDTDVDMIKEGYITVTPLHYDLTNFNLITRMESILEK